MLTKDEFLERCEEIIADYVETYFPGKSIPVPTEINPYLIWKDYWTEGASSDQITSNANQKAIYGLETDIDKYMFVCTYQSKTNKIYLTPLFADPDISYDDVESNL